MRRLLFVSLLPMLFLAACSGSKEKSVKAAPVGFSNFMLNEQIAVDGAKVEFRLSSDGASLNAYISATPSKGTRYFIELYSQEKQLLQPRMEKTSRANLVLDFNKINKSNVEAVKYFKFRTE